MIISILGIALWVGIVVLIVLIAISGAQEGLRKHTREKDEGEHPRGTLSTNGKRS